MEKAKGYTVGMQEIADLLDKIAALEDYPTMKETVLWNILTSLRGPDSMDEKLKNRTTAELRGKICPRLAARMGAIYTSSKEPLVRVDSGGSGNNHHFINHFNAAVAGLSALRRGK